MATILSNNLVVTAKAHGLPTAWYTVHPCAPLIQALTFRFSELDEMHRRLVKEVPTFTGRMPPKTLMRDMSDNFIETRREAIEVYLRRVSTDEMATASRAWHEFVVRACVRGCMVSNEATHLRLQRCSRTRTSNGGDSDVQMAGPGGLVEGSVRPTRHRFGESMAGFLVDGLLSIAFP